MVETMNEQLILLRPAERPWRLDDHTREIGRRGVEEARAALRRGSAADGPHVTHRATRRTAA
jgi:hypothetical protein